MPSLGASVSPDGRRVLALDPEGTPVLYPLAGGDPLPVPNLLQGDVAIGWTADGNGFFYYDVDEPAARIHRLDLRMRRSQLWRELLPSRPAGMFTDYRILITPDGGSSVLNYSKLQTVLMLAEGLQ
jgi:hypothetical protein